MKEFKEFIKKQGVVGLAVGFILGGAVSSVVSSLVNDIVNPIVGLFTGVTGGLENWKVILGPATISIGNFISVMIDFSLPTTKATIVEINGLKVAYFSIPKGTEYVHLTSDGKCLKRRDLESVPVSPETIQFERNEKTSREYDRSFVDEADITSLDIDLTVIYQEFCTPRKSS